MKTYILRRPRSIPGRLFRAVWLASLLSLLGGCAFLDHVGEIPAKPDNRVHLGWQDGPFSLDRSDVHTLYV